MSRDSKFNRADGLVPGLLMALAAIGYRFFAAEDAAVRFKLGVLIAILLGWLGYLFFQGREAKRRLAQRSQEGPEPLGGLIEFAIWDDEGKGIGRFRYDSLDTHRYSNDQVAGELVDRAYKCWMPSGELLLQVEYERGIRAQVFSEAGDPRYSFVSQGLDPSFYSDSSLQVEVELSSGKLFAWHSNGQLAVAGVTSRALWRAWGQEIVDPSPQAVQSPLSRKCLREFAEPLFQSALQDANPGVRDFAQRGLDALRQPADLFHPMQIVPALFVLNSEEALDVEASVLCQSVRSTDREVRAQAEQALEQFNPEAATAAYRLVAVMGEMGSESAAYNWALRALRKIGPAATEVLSDLALKHVHLRPMVDPAIEALRQPVPSA